MANIDVGGGVARRKPMDASVPLVPFIDLLLCCVMFLLVTAVWNEMARLPVHVAGAGAPDQTLDVLPDRVKLTLYVQHDGYVIATGAGDRVTLPRVKGALDTTALADRLTLLRQRMSEATPVTLIADDGIAFDAVTSTIDTMRGAGFGAIAFGNDSP